MDNINEFNKMEFKTALYNAPNECGKMYFKLQQII